MLFSEKISNTLSAISVNIINVYVILLVTRTWESNHCPPYLAENLGVQCI